MINKENKGESHMSTRQKVLFIAYYFEPYQGVGAKRVSYWFNKLNEKYKNEYTCDVITATKTEDTQQIKYIADDGKSVFTRIVKDAGLTWYKKLLCYLKSIDWGDYDYILITGSPFMHFRLSKILKQKTISKIVLDFRDPFAINPRFNNNLLSVNIKKYFEKKFIKYSDHIITVNDFCSNLLQTNNDSKLTIIDNGYDENYFKEVRIKTLSPNLSFIYAGSFYIDRNPVNFLKTIQTTHDQYKLIHVGENSDLLQPYKDLVNEVGSQSYMNTVRYLEGADVGLIFTSGESFESTTKIFDYIGADLKILIITDGDLFSGQLHNITKKLEGVYWSSNDLISINEILHKIVLEKDIIIKRKNKLDYSRKNSLDKLLNVFTDK